MQNKIPNSDIIGYEGPVGREKSIHKYTQPAPGKSWKSKKKATWIRIGPGRFILAKPKNEVKDE